MSEIDLSQLPAPAIVAPLDFEAVLAELKAQVLADLPELADVIELESEPVNKVLQVVAYQRVNMQARINDAARACMLAYAVGADLDHLAALLGVARLVVDHGDPNAQPPVPPTYESDTRLRQRAQMAMEGTTVAGSRGAYTFHALTASARVHDVAVDSPAPGEVRITLLAADNDGQPDAELLATVSSHLSDAQRRPLTDTVVVEGASPVDYQISATLHMYPGPSSATVLAAARAALDAYIAQAARIGHDIPRSAIFAALHQSGVRLVELAAPAADISIGPREAARCTAITLIEGVRDV